MSHHGRGLCSTCRWIRIKAGKELPAKPQRDNKDSPAQHRVGVVQCEGQGCDKMLRPHGANAKDYPGTYARKAHYRCSSCYEAMLVDGTITPERISTTARTLNAYLAWRRPFRAKAGVSA